MRVWPVSGDAESIVKELWNWSYVTVKAYVVTVSVLVEAEY